MLKTLRTLQAAAANLFGADPSTRIQQIMDRVDINLQSQIATFAANHPDLQLDVVPHFKNGGVIYKAPDFSLEITPISGTHKQDLSRVTEDSRNRLAALVPYEGGVRLQFIQIVENSPIFHQSVLLYPKGNTRNAKGNANHIALDEMFRLIPQRNTSSLRIHVPAEEFKVA